MAGHSKWANIKHRKGRQDAKRGKIFTKLVKEIMIAAKMGGSDIGGNPRLRTAVAKAKAENLPKDNIDKAIKKGAGELDGVVYEEGTYEGYGPKGVAVIVSYMTDNKNRTVSDVRSTFTKAGGNLGETGSVAFMFDKKGLFTFAIDMCSEEDMMEIAIEAGAEDVITNTDDEVYEVYTDPGEFHSVLTKFEEGGHQFKSADLSMIPQTTTEVAGKDVEKVLNFLDRLEDLDDVQDVYSNVDISEEELEKMS